MRRGDDWCILRTAPSATMALAAALVEAGIEAWTPVEVQSRRTRQSSKEHAVSIATLPGIVFARYDRLGDLVAMSKAPSLSYRVWDKEQKRMVVRGRPYFSAFRTADGYGWIADRELDPLRQAEARAKPRAKVVPLRPGQSVTCSRAGFDGLSGIVETTRGRYALVCFAGLSIPVQIETGQLNPVTVAKAG